ncbi:unnamed protein product [Pleuronectes platessa]|uniref:LIM zinc-binding domain-containing protein n=1 Tax=Pleuronectes platessa TaxID=8262 RepID=A0A9N7YNW3_PLEPL|nr:unnamed protein product [Pleuronectes platessa]
MSYVSPAACQDQSSTHTGNKHIHTLPLRAGQHSPWPGSPAAEDTSRLPDAPQPAVTVDLTSPYFVDMGDMGDPPKKKRLVSLCVGCGNQIHDQYILRVSPDLEWHAACLKCAECSQYLDESCTCFVRDGKTYCKRDYISRQLTLQRRGDAVRSAGRRAFLVESTTTCANERGMALETPLSTTAPAPDRCRWQVSRVPGWRQAR